MLEKAASDPLTPCEPCMSLWPVPLLTCARLLADGELDRDEGIAQDALAFGARKVVEADASDHRCRRDALWEEQVVQVSAWAVPTSASVLGSIGSVAVACRLVDSVRNRLVVFPRGQRPQI
jgi:hypothetical protein